MILYSAEKHACYNTALSHHNVPTDVIEITKDEHKLFIGVDIENGKQLVKNKHPFEFEDIPEPTETELAQLAQSEMITELNWCDLQIKLHASSDKRAVSALDDIYAYARACRDYVRNIDGELIVVGDKPVRPT